MPKEKQQHKHHPDSIPELFLTVHNNVFMRFITQHSIPTIGWALTSACKGFTPCTVCVYHQVKHLRVRERACLNTGVCTVQADQPSATSAAGRKSIRALQSITSTVIGLPPQGQQPVTPKEWCCVTNHKQRRIPPGTWRWDMEGRQEREARCFQTTDHCDAAMSVISLLTCM